MIDIPNLTLQWLSPHYRGDIKAFYRRFMPYARVLQKEAVVSLQLEGQPLAAVRFRPVGRFTLMTGMLVRPEYRQQGIGNYLLRQVSPLFTDGVLFAFCQPELSCFYQQHGFTNGTTPNDISQLHQRYCQQNPTLTTLGYQHPTGKQAKAMMYSQPLP